MQRLLLALGLTLSLSYITVPVYAATCTGAANCRACSNCSRCKHCGKSGGSCGVCAVRRGTTAGNLVYRPAVAPTPDTRVYSPRHVPPPSNEPSWVRMQRIEKELEAQRQARLKRAQQQKASLAKFSGKCVGVKDGDTIEVKDGCCTRIIRLYGIDAPEKSQAYGAKAKQFASSMAFGKVVTVYPTGIDRYGRTLGWVFVGNKCLDAELVSNGLAWWYRQYSPKETKLAQLEAQARGGKRGLWADAAPVAPWSYRRH